MPPAGYDEEQDKLRRIHDGDPDPEDIKIDVPRDLPEVNPEIFRDVDPMLFRGFLHTPAEINGTPFIFKSLNHHEFGMLRLSMPESSAWKSVHRFHALFLAYGVFMVDGINVLADRDQHLGPLAEFFESMEAGASVKVIRHMSEINRRANRAVVLTEAYSMELVSRLRWAQLGGIDLTGTPVTGIQGTHNLGLNWGQLTWRAMNYYEDLKERAEREWENAKFVASSMAGKGMSRIHSQDKRRRDKDREDRLERRDRILRFALLGESMDSASNQGAAIQVARTVEELSNQLERDLKGEKDWHDLVVEAHEKRAQEERERREQHLRTLQQGFDEQYGPRQLFGQSSLQGLTAEEVRFQIDRRRQLTAQRLASQTHPEFMDPKAAEFTNKWSGVSRTNRDPSQIPMVSTSGRPPGTPFNPSRK
jgi:hypothetical protein